MDGTYSEYGVFQRGDDAESRLLSGFSVSVDAVFDVKELRYITGMVPDLWSLYPC